jgi:outer membrane lipoprotein-sorting protein
MLWCGAFFALWVAPLAAPAALAPELLRVAERMRAVQTLQVSLTQEKEMAAFGDVVRASGRVVLARPKKLLLDLEGPGGTTLVVSGDRMRLTYKALKKTEDHDLSRDLRAKAVADHLFLLLDADPQALQEVYEVSVTKRAPLEARLVPKAEALRRILRHVDLRFDAALLVETLVLQEDNGDVTRWRFSKPRVNEPLSKADSALLALTP